MSTGVCFSSELIHIRKSITGKSAKVWKLKIISGDRREICTFEVCINSRWKK
jgi:hypothetical protein